MINVCVVVCPQYQSHYSRHFMPLGEKERQDREVFQRNMKSRMETFKSTRHKRHKKERSLKKVRHCLCIVSSCCVVHEHGGYREKVEQLAGDDFTE